VEERGEPDVIELQAREAETAAERNRENADVHGVRERVVVVVADGGETHERGFVGENLVDDSLHHAFDLLDVRPLPHAHRIHHVFRRGNGLREGALGRLLRLDANFLVVLRLDRRRHFERKHAGVVETFLQRLEACRGPVSLRREQEREEDSPVACGRLGLHAQHADAARAAE
jgi:hypothetical protein